MKLDYVKFEDASQGKACHSWQLNIYNSTSLESIDNDHVSRSERFSQYLNQIEHEIYIDMQEQFNLVFGWSEKLYDAFCILILMICFSSLCLYAYLSFLF